MCCHVQVIILHLNGLYKNVKQDNHISIDDGDNDEGSGVSGGSGDVDGIDVGVGGGSSNQEKIMVIDWGTMIIRNFSFQKFCFW